MRNKNLYTDARTYSPVVALVLRNRDGRALAVHEGIIVIVGTEATGTGNSMHMRADLSI